MSSQRAEIWTLWRHSYKQLPAGEFEITGTTFADVLTLRIGTGFEYEEDQEAVEAALFDALAPYGITPSTHEMTCDGPECIWLDRFSDGACEFTLDRGDTRGAALVCDDCFDGDPRLRPIQESDSDENGAASCEQCGKSPYEPAPPFAPPSRAQLDAYKEDVARAEMSDADLDALCRDCGRNLRRS